MRKVEFFNFLLPPDAWRKKPSPSRWKMTMQDAAKKHPGATPILSSREVREVPETPEEEQMVKMTFMRNPPMPKS